MSFGNLNRLMSSPSSYRWKSWTTGVSSQKDDSFSTRWCRAGPEVCPGGLTRTSKHPWKLNYLFHCYRLELQHGWPICGALQKGKHCLAALEPDHRHLSEHEPPSDLPQPIGVAVETWLRWHWSCNVHIKFILGWRLGTLSRRAISPHVSRALRIPNGAEKGSKLISVNVGCKYWLSLVGTSTIFIFI